MTPDSERRLRASEERAQQASDELREKNELLSALLDALPLPVNVLDAEGRVTLWNKACERDFGWAAEEALGTFVPSLAAEERANFEARQRLVFAGERIEGVEAKGLRRDGSLIEMSLSVAPVYGPDGKVVGSMGISVDVTEQHRAAEALQASNKRFQALLEASPLPITAIDIDGRTTLWNDAAERHFGWSADEVLGKALPMIPPEGMEEWAARRARLLRGETLTDVPVRRIRRDGAYVDHLLSVAPIYGANGEVTGTMGISIDVTEHNRAFELLRKGDEERRTLLSKLVRAQEEERQRIAADIHDDSVQVLTALALRLEMLRRKTDDASALESLAEAERTARLAITRLRHLMFELRPPVLDRDGLAAALIMHMEQARLDFGVEFTFQDELEIEPEGDTRAVIFRIAQEALVNVVKHANASTVALRLRSRGGGVLVRVTDDGRGFDLASDPGAHFGLVAMRERAEMSGGWCHVRSAPGKGTLVEFFVPSSDSTEEQVA